MLKHDEYRKYAMDAVRLATCREHWCQELLLALAERWLDLADTENKRAKAGSASE